MPTGRLAFALVLLNAGFAMAQQPAPDDASRAISDRLHTLRSLPDDMRARVTRQLALEIRQLPDGAKIGPALNLANLATEGDFGRDTLQDVTTTLELALREIPLPRKPGPAYAELANLARYEHMQVGLSDPQYAAAMAKLEADDLAIGAADFTLTDMEGKQWTLKSLRGSVVLVNFWATWCGPCRKEIPDLDALYKKLKDKGLVILAISGEEAGKVKPFVEQQRFSYPVLTDPDGGVLKRFRIGSIPKTFVYDREGKLVAQSIDMRTGKQFLEMLRQAGME